MHPQLSLTPRYTLDDSSPWLVGIDPVRRYWIKVNGESDQTIQIPGMMSASLNIVKQAIQSFRASQPGMTMTLPTAASATLKIYHVNNNLYAVPAMVEGATAWHLFDAETIESFLLTAHPDWQCAPQDVALGRTLLCQAWEQPSAA
ncbi:MAG: hypothetical protein AAFU71_02955 [Cyanobacteria bacterium J06632_22]